MGSSRVHTDELRARQIGERKSDVCWSLRFAVSWTTRPLSPSCGRAGPVADSQVQDLSRGVVNALETVKGAIGVIRDKDGCGSHGIMFTFDMANSAFRQGVNLRDKSVE